MPGQGLKSTTVYRISGGLFCCALSLLAGRAESNAAEAISLAPSRQAGQTVAVEVIMQVGGELLLSEPAKTVAAGPAVRKLPMTVGAKLIYEERIIQLRSDEKGTSRSVRFYPGAKALVEIEKGNQKPVLSEGHRLIAVEAAGAATTLICPHEPLSREELDLIDVAGNTLLLDELLPSKPVAPGDTWKHSDDLLAALLRLDAVSLGDAQSMLAEVDAKTGEAKITLAGTVHGAVGGVATEIELKAKYTFNLKARQITLFALLVKEKRSIGHVSPGLDVVAKQIVKIRPLATSDHLDDAAVAAAKRATGDAAERLAFESPLNRFRMEHDRRWFVTGDEKRLTVFRLVDRGELMAQCNIASIDPVPAGETFALADFQRDIEKTLGKSFGQFVSAKEQTDPQGRRVYRVVANGAASDLPIQWIYYMYTTQEGRRLSVAFTLEQPLVERFGASDVQFLKSLEVLTPQTASTDKATPTAK